MISLYSGTPGSGKSLHAAQNISNRSRSGRPVIGNFPVNLEKYPKANYTYISNQDLTPEFLIRFSREFFQGKKIKEGAILLVIDECQLIFNSREWQQRGRAEWLSFFSQHRHFGYDIILIAQFDRMIDRQIRSLIEYEYKHRKMSNCGVQGKILSVVLGGKTFISVQMWYPLGLKVASDLYHARKSLYSIYDSYAIFNASLEEGQKTQETATLPSHAEQIGTGLEAVQPKKHRIFKKQSIAEKQVKMKKSKKVRYVGFYEEPFFTAWYRVFYRGKFTRKYPENRNEFGWMVK